MRIFRAPIILNRGRPEGLEHLVRAATEQDRVAVCHVLQIRSGELFVRQDPVELAVGGRKVAVGTHMIERDDSSHVTRPAHRTAAHWATAGHLHARRQSDQLRRRLALWLSLAAGLRNRTRFATGDVAFGS
jgi:hypothetical protein